MNIAIRKINRIYNIKFENLKIGLDNTLNNLSKVG